MKRKVVVVLAIFASVGTAIAAGRANTAFPLKISAFQAGFRNCSRPTPQGMTAFWQVTPPEVEKIDQALMQYLDVTALTKQLKKPPSAYGRQYLGYNRGARRFVYINAYLKAPSDAKSTYVRKCDGGNQSWGIEYDVQQKVFSGFETDVVMKDPLDGLKI